MSDSERYGEMMRNSFATMQGTHFTVKENNYHFLADQGIDTVLETAVLRFGLSGDQGMNPPLVFFMSLYVRLVRTSDGSVLYMERFGYSGKERKFTEWAFENAKPFREEFSRCYENLAEQVVNAIFVRNDLSSVVAAPPGSDGEMKSNPLK
jgi:hypothetical protein